MATDKLGWEARLDRAEKRGEFSKKDKTDITNWHTCMVSEIVGGNPYRQPNLERDFATSLFEMALDAMSAVAANDLSQAREIWNRINTAWGEYQKRKEGSEQTAGKPQGDEK